MMIWNRIAPLAAALLALALFSPSSARADAADLPPEPARQAPPASYKLRPAGKSASIVEKVNEVCAAKPSPAVSKALGCDLPYWKDPGTLDLDRENAPAGALRPNQRSLCAELVEINDGGQDKKPIASLLRACGLRENPLPLVEKACRDLDREGQRLEKPLSPDEEDTLAARAKELAGRGDLKPAEAAEREAAQRRLQASAEARAVEGYQKSLRCSARAWAAAAEAGKRWSGDPARSPAGVCAAVAGKPPKGISSVRALRRECGFDLDRAGAIVSPAAALGMTVVQGFGDFLKSRAKEELIDFAVAQLGRQFCACDAPQKVTGATLFPRTCAVIFPQKKSESGPPPTCSLGEPNIGGITSGEFQKVFLEEMGELPGRIIELLPIAWDKLYDDPAQGRALQVMLAQTANTLLTITRYNKEYLTFLVDLEKAVRAKVGDGGALECRFEAGKAPTAPCVLGLLLTVAATAGPKPPLDAEDLRAWVQRAATQFCQHYGARTAGGAAGARPEDESCVAGAGPEVWKQVDAFITAVSDFHERMGKVSEAAQKAREQGKFPMEIAILALPEVAEAVAALDDAILGVVKVLAPRAGMDAGKLDKLVRTLDLVGQALRVVSAGVKQDVRAVAGAMRIIVTVDLIQGEVNPAFKKGLLFACDLAEAKTADDARKVFEDYAAPRDSYRAKYGTARTLLALNAYVGIFGTARAPLVHASAAAGYKAPGQTWVSPLSAPVGLDFTFPLRHDADNHVGLLLTVMDPLEMRTTESSGTTVPDFAGILAPGAFFRVGIRKSPVAFIVGGRVQPLLKSTEMCGGSSCWQAPISGMIGFAVDVPVLPLSY